MVHDRREWQAQTQQWQEKWQAQTQQWRTETQQWQAKAQEWQDKNQILLSHVLESIDSLSRVALVHERRITNLEGQPGS